MSEISGRYVNQNTLADFIEEYDHIFSKPSPVEMLDIVTKIRLTKRAEFTSEINKSNGDVNFQYKAETGGAGDLIIPEILDVNIALYRGLAPFKV